MMSALGAADILADLATIGTELQGGSASKIYREGNAWVQEVSGTLPAAKAVKVSTDAGSVRVTGAAQTNVTYVMKKRVYTSSEEAARKRFEQFKVSAATVGEAAVFRGQCESRHGRASVDFEIRAPQGVALVYVRTEGGSVAVNNIKGRADLHTSGGSIQVNDIGGAVVAETFGGSIDVGSVAGEVKAETSGGSISVRDAGNVVRAETSGGSIHLDFARGAAFLTTAGGGIRVGTAGGDLQAETAGGSIDVGMAKGAAMLRTAGGSIRVGAASGTVDAETAGGGIRLYNLARGARAQTAAGSLYAEFVGDRSAFTDSRFETSAGDITVVLPEKIGVNVRAIIELASGHKIRSEFAELRVTSEGGEFGPREIFGEGAINGGGPVLKLHTTIGNIDLKKGKR